METNNVEFNSFMVGNRKLMRFEYKGKRWLLWSNNDLTKYYEEHSKNKTDGTNEFQVVSAALKSFLQENPEKNDPCLQKYNLVLKNSDTTPASLVEQFLNEIMGIEVEQAKVLTKQVDTTGSCSIGPYTAEVVDTAVAYMEFIKHTMSEEIALPVEKVKIPDEQHINALASIEVLLRAAFPEDI